MTNLTDNLMIVVPFIASEDDYDGIAANLGSLIGLMQREGLAGTPDPHRRNHFEAFENEVFAINPYYWGDCDCGFDEREAAWCENNPHTGDCYQLRVREQQIAAGWTTAGEGMPMEAPKGMSYDVREKILQEIRHTLCDELGLPRFGCAVHCTCDRMESYEKFKSQGLHLSTCGYERPNFIHKSSGSRIDWYKSVGHDLKVHFAKNYAPEDVFADCVRSVVTAK